MKYDGLTLNPAIKPSSLNFTLNLNLEEVMNGVFTGNFPLLRTRSEITFEEVLETNLGLSATLRSA